MLPPLLIIEPFGSHMIIAFLYSIYYNIPPPLDVSKLSAFTRRGVIHRPLINKGPFLNYVPGSRDIPFSSDSHSSIIFNWWGAFLLQSMIIFFSEMCATGPSGLIPMILRKNTFYLQWRLSRWSSEHVDLGMLERSIRITPRLAGTPVHRG